MIEGLGTRLVMSITSHTVCLEGHTSNGSYFVKFDVQLGSLYPILVPRLSLGGPGNEGTCNQFVWKNQQANKLPWLAAFNLPGLNDSLRSCKTPLNINQITPIQDVAASYLSTWDAASPHASCL